MEINLLGPRGELNYLDSLVPWGMGCQTKFHAFETYQETLPLSKGDLLMIGGQNLNDGYFNEPFYRQKRYDLRDRLFETIRDARVPVLGVNQGFELVVKSCGGSLAFLNDRPYGPTELVIEQPDHPIFTGLEADKSPKVNFSYRWALKTIPEELRVLARAEGLGAVIVAHAKKPIYGFYFKPVQYPNGDPLIKKLLSAIQEGLLPVGP